MHHPEYARWAVKYYENLINLPDTHPDVHDDFKKGLFAIKRTKKLFLSTAIDLALEQTINKDAASQKRGIFSLTNTIAAIQRCAESHYLRTSIISDVFEELGMSQKEDITKDLKKYKITKDNSDVNAVKLMINGTMNPFDTQLNNDHLFNLGTGKAALPETESFLLIIDKLGEEQRKRFVFECIQSDERFEKPIQRNKIRSFATQAGKHKLQGKDGKIVAACFVRDLFGTLLYLSLEKKLICQ